MADTFTFANKTLVPVTVAPDPIQGVSMNGWTFTARPTVPYQKKFKVTLYGMRWYTNAVTGAYDSSTNLDYNARALELFYERNGIWKPFQWAHPHLGLLNVRFNKPLNVPEGLPNSGGLIEKVEIELIHHDPGYV